MTAKHVSLTNHNQRTPSKKATTPLPHSSQTRAWTPCSLVSFHTDLSEARPCWMVLRLLLLLLRLLLLLHTIHPCACQDHQSAATLLATALDERAVCC